jgi:homoaconitate hydratase
MPQNLIEKIAQNFAVGLPAGHVVQSGDYLSIRPAHVMTHDNTAAVIPKFRAMGAARVKDPGQPIYALDHDIQNESPENLAKYAKIRDFAAEQGVTFYPAGRGIGHQVMVEEGYVLPGTFVVGSDSHSNLYGALGALGTPVVRTDAAAIWATGRTWWQVPEIVQVRLTGKLRSGVVGKDVIVALCGVFNNDEVLNCCIEFAGDGAAHLSIEERMTISNMTTEWGALAGVFPYDDVTRQYLLDRAAAFAHRGDKTPRITPEMVQALDRNVPRADDRAYYAKVLELDLAAVTPFASGPNTVKTITPVPELQQKQVRIDKAYLMSCVNGRLQDFAAAAQVIAGKKVADHVQFYIAAASDEVERQAREKGYWQTLVDAGATALPPGCGACIGLGQGTLAAGEVGISATNRNFKGRMGSRDANVYLASPAVVAASAIAGHVAAPTKFPAENAFDTMKQASRVTVNSRPESAAAQVSLMAGFPAELTGELLLLPVDNLNTDGIYGKDYTYKEGMTPDEMAQVAMENYDPQFQQIAQSGDILIAGYNFGTGSSREQAATALKYRGMQMIVAGSFSQTYKRNAFNNGYICIECPALVDGVRDAMKAQKAPTIRTGWRARVDFTASKLTVDMAGGGTQSFGFSPLGEVAQELVVKGGFEAVIRDQLE